MYKINEKKYRKSVKFSSFCETQDTFSQIMKNKNLMRYHAVLGKKRACNEESYTKTMETDLDSGKAVEGGGVASTGNVILTRE